MLRLRGDVVTSLRERLGERGYLEVETPMLQPVHGGAAARPFTTKMNAYNLDLYLRIAPELYLKRLLVGGVGKVFEINRNFRNEGVSPRHNPEFTMLEAYEPYGDYNTMAALTRDLVLAAARAALGGTVIMRDGVEYDLAQPWHEITVYDSVSEALGEQVTPATSLRTLQKHADRIGLNHNPEWDQGKLTQELFETLVESTLRSPTFVRDYPASTSPLTRHAPRLAGPRGKVGPDRLRPGARHRVLRAHRPDRAAPQPHRAVASRRRRRSRGDGPRPGLPARIGVRHAAGGRNGHGRRPVDHDPYRPQHSRHDPVPAAEAGVLSPRSFRARAACAERHYSR